MLILLVIYQEPCLLIVSASVCVFAVRRALDDGDDGDDDDGDDNDGEQLQKGKGHGNWLN